MKNLPLISASLLIGSLVISSCSTNKLATSGTDDNLYFMASDVKLATQFAVDNNNPQSFKNISQEPALAEQNFSTRNVNPEYISRYQTTENSAIADDGVVYFDEGATQQTSSGNINAYDNYSAARNVNGNNGFNSPNINFNVGMGFGMGGMMMSPWGFYDPFWGPAWGFRPGFSFGLGFGWGNPMWGMGMGWGNPMWGMGMGWGNPMWGMGMGWGNPMWGWGRPIHVGRPIFVLPGGEFGDRRVVSGARPTRGSSITNSGTRSSQASVMPNTARAQARGNATAGNNSSARRIGANENSRGATRDFSNSQNDYYNSSSSRTATARNINSPVTNRGTATTRSSSAVPSARTTNAYSPSNNTRSYSPARNSTPNYNTRTSNPAYNNNRRTTSPSYNRNSTPTFNNRSTTPTYNRNMNPTNNRVTTPSRSSSPSFSAPSRSSGGGMSAPSRSSGGSSGGSRGGRGN